MEDRATIREKHGIANAGRISAATVENSNIQEVLVTGGFGEVIISLSTSLFPAALTPEQALMFARQINASAMRISRARKLAERKEG